MPNLNCNQSALALHGTSSQLGLALSNFADDTTARTWNLGQDLSTHLQLYLAEFLKPYSWRDLAWIAITRGPGSFTGTRVGLVTARTLAQQLEIPLFAVSTLAAAVWSQTDKRQQSFQKPIAIQMNARRGQLFVAIYEVAADGWGLVPQLSDQVMTTEAWQETLENLETAYQLIDTPADLGETVTSVLELAYLDWQQGKRPHWSEALPFYGQHPV